MARYILHRLVLMIPTLIFIKLHYFRDYPTPPR